MPTVYRTVPVQMKASEPAQNVRVDGNLATLVMNKAKHGLTSRDVDAIFRSPQLNDAPPSQFQRAGEKRDEYANKTEGAVLAPLFSAAHDRRRRPSLDGQTIRFTSDASRDHFKSVAGKWFAENAGGPAAKAIQQAAPEAAQMAQQAMAQQS